MSHTTDRIYRDSTHGISLADIAYVIADNSDMGKSPNIKTYAKYKPCGGTKVGELTEAERKALNCGIDCTDTATGCFSSSLSNLLTRAKASRDWTKVTPTWSRVLDFDGYYHKAQAPYQRQTSLTGNTTGDLTMYINLALNAVLENGNMRVSDLEGALTAGGRSISSYHFGLLYRNVNTPTADPALIDLGSANLEGANPGGTFHITSIAPPVSYSGITYDCCFIVFVQSGSSYYGCFIPQSYFQMKLALFAILKSDAQTSLEGETLEFPQAGGQYSMWISGFEWEMETGHELNISLDPSHGSDTSAYTSADLIVGSVPSGTTAITGYLIQQVRIAAPSRVTANPGFDKVFNVKQACPIPSGTGHMERTDSAGTKLSNQIEIPTTAEAETTFYLTYDCAWTRVAIEKNVDGEWVATTDIQVPPASRPAPSGRYETYETYVFNDVSAGLTSGTEYRVRYNDENNSALYTLNILVQ